VENKPAKTHPLDLLDDKTIKKAYTICKVFYVILALCAVAGGITMSVLSKQKVWHSSRYGGYYTDDTNGGLLAGGLVTLFCGPVVIWLSWLFTRLIFMLLHDVSIIRQATVAESKLEKPSK